MMMNGLYIKGQGPSLLLGCENLNILRLTERERENKRRVSRWRMNISFYLVHSFTLRPFLVQVPFFIMQKKLIYSFFLFRRYNEMNMSFNEQ